MESAQAKVRYVVEAPIIKLWEEKRRQHISGVGPEAQFEEQSLGWFMYLYGSREAIFLGHEKPAFEPGDRVKITFEKVPNAQP